MITIAPYPECSSRKLKNIWAALFSTIVIGFRDADLVHKFTVNLGPPGGYEMRKLLKSRNE